MNKLLNYACLLIVILLLVGCTAERGKGELTRVDVSRLNHDGKYEDVIITDHESIEILKTAFANVKWDPNSIPSMARIEDVQATLFFEFDKNMPERLYEYKIWFNDDGSATIISNNEKEGLGKLDKDNVSLLKTVLIKTS